MKRNRSRKISIPALISKKNSNDPITWLTCYDYSMACAIARTELDMILVGDSGGMVLLGYEDTVPVTMEEMISMCRSVRRGAPHKFVIGDMPKGSYETSNHKAVENAMRFCKEGLCDAVKLEGGHNVIERVQSVTRAGIPVLGHVGLTPQTSAMLGGYRVVGKDDEESQQVLEAAKQLEAAGAVAILVEAVPEKLGHAIASELRIPTLGIGSGNLVDGQLLIIHDLLGLYPNFRPKFAKCFVPDVLDDFKNYLDCLTDSVESGRVNQDDGLFEITVRSIKAYIEAVRSRNFPSSSFIYD